MSKLTWKGRPIEELSHAELLEAFEQLAEMYNRHMAEEKRVRDYLFDVMGTSL